MAEAGPLPSFAATLPAVKPKPPELSLRREGGSPDPGRSATLPVLPSLPTSPQGTSPRRLGGPSTSRLGRCSETGRPWPEGIAPPWELRRSSLSPKRSSSRSSTSRQTARSSTTSYRGLEKANSLQLSVLSNAEEEAGLGNATLRAAILELARAKREIQRLLADLAEESNGRRSVNIEAQQAKVDAMFTFLTQGGELPDGLELPRGAYVAGSFASEVPKLAGGFLCTKGGVGPARPRRALYAIRGTVGGRVALQRLPALGPSDGAEVRKLAVADPIAPGGCTADPVAVQRLLRPVPPKLLLEWASEVLSCDVPSSLQVLEEAMAQAREENEREQQAAQQLALYNSRALWREAMRARRAPLLRELWGALWNSNGGRLKSIFFAMERLGMSGGEKVFHEVALWRPGGGNYSVTLHPEGATSEEADLLIAKDLTRRHACTTARDAYECMRVDPAAPPGNHEVLRWLAEHCGDSAHAAWCFRLFEHCPGRQMMVNKAFTQSVLSELIKEARAIQVPGEVAQEEEEGDRTNALEHREEVCRPGGTGKEGHSEDVQRGRAAASALPGLGPRLPGPRE